MTPPPGTGWTRCQYFGFWDVPRALVIHREGRTLFLDSPFDESLDDYAPDYKVWELEPVEPEAVLGMKWEELERRKLRQLDAIPVSSLEFHPERERDSQLRHFYAWYRFRSDKSAV